MDLHPELDRQLRELVNLEKVDLPELSSFLAAVDGAYRKMGAVGALDTGLGQGEVDPATMFQMVLDNIPARVFWKDRDCRIAGCNQSFAQDMGADRVEKVIGLNDFDFAVEAKAALYFQEVDRRVMESGQAEYRIREHISNQNGREAWLETNKVPIRDREGRVMGILGTYEDITDRVDSEERMRAANDQLAHAAMMKDQFLAGMSHELRTPLNSILGVSEALQEGVYGELTDRQVMAMRRVEDGGRHLLALINDILDLARLEAGETVLDFQPVGARSVCEGSLSFVKEQAAKKGLSLTWRVQDQVDFFIGDERRVKQMLVNLLSNAVKFTEDGGKVNLTATGDMLRSEVTFAVQDSGIGISGEDLAKLFQPFRQLDSRLARQYNGAGLGLSIVKHMAQLHGGRVSVTSVPGQGSCFSITLPWRTRLDAAKVPGRVEEAPLQPTAPVLNLKAAQHRGAVRALVIEDSLAAAEQISRYLGELGVEAAVAGTGEQALAQVIARPPDVIFLDIMLPGIDGWEVLAKLKANPRSSQIPVIVLSVVDERQRSLRNGAAGYLMKPVTRQQLESILSPVVTLTGPETRQPKEPEAPIAKAKATLLLAEDNEENIATFSEYLEANGYAVAVARHGVEALEMMMQLTPSLILMDVQMPVMDGLEATRQLRENPATAGYPIICLTAMALPGDERKCLEAGADAYLSKPVRLKELLAAVRRFSRDPQALPLDGVRSSRPSEAEVGELLQA